MKETLIGHKESVTCIDCISLPDNTLLCASVAADCNLNIWKKEGTESSKWVLEQTIPFGRKMMDCVCLSLLGASHIPILAVGGVDSLIHLFIYVNNKFIKLFSLQGHQDWIRSLSFATLDNNDILLASSSQDCKIRIWRINPLASDSNLLSTFGKDNTSNNNSTSTNAVSSKGYIFKVNEIQYSILLESVLTAHEQWVYSVSWQPPFLDKEGKYCQPLSLLSASMDKSMMIWRPSSQSEGIWIPYVSVGELGGNTLGFYGGQFNPDGTSILANGFNGAFHLWKKSLTSENTEEWSADVSISGHFGPVMDLEWDPSRSYLLSVSEDQTSRLFSPWKRGSTSTWHELGRPQIHGYDLECLSFIGPFQIITGADEKVLRVFDAPQTSISTLNQISDFKTPEHLEARPLGANVPPLGLSNKPVFNENEMNADIKFEDYENPVPAPIVHNLPPVEDYLLQSTLWPETHKLYGHPNELVSVCTNHKGTLIASSCKGTKPDQSSIKIWDAKSWKEVANIVFHTLTVVQLEFSHDDKYLMSVSRDRQMAIFSITETTTSKGEEGEDNKPIIELVFKTKTHERIIWSGTWSFDDKYIATGSRDKLVKIWTKVNNSWGCVLTLPEFTSGVTSVSWGPVAKNKDGNLFYTLAVGLETGEITLWNIIDGANINASSIIATVPKMQTHIETVRRLRWNILNENIFITESNSKYLLATCSTDNSIRLFTINFNMLMK